MTPHTCFGKKVSPSYGILEAKDRGRCNKSFSTRSRLYNLRRRDVIGQNEPKTGGNDRERIFYPSLKTPMKTRDFARLNRMSGLNAREGDIHRPRLSFPETICKQYQFHTTWMQSHDGT